MVLRGQGADDAISVTGHGAHDDEQMKIPRIAMPLGIVPHGGARVEVVLKRGTARSQSGEWRFDVVVPSEAPKSVVFDVVEGDNADPRENAVLQTITLTDVKFEPTSGSFMKLTVDVSFRILEDGRLYAVVGGAGRTRSSTSASAISHTYKTRAPVSGADLVSLAKEYGRPRALPYDIGVAMEYGGVVTLMPRMQNVVAGEMMVFEETIGSWGYMLPAETRDHECTKHCERRCDESRCTKWKRLCTSQEGQERHGSVWDGKTEYWYCSDQDGDGHVREDIRDDDVHLKVWEGSDLAVLRTLSFPVGDVAQCGKIPVVVIFEVWHDRLSVVLDCGGMTVFRETALVDLRHRLLQVGAPNSTAEPEAQS